MKKVVAYLCVIKFQLFALELEIFKILPDVFQNIAFEMLQRGET